LTCTNSTVELDSERQDIPASHARVDCSIAATSVACSFDCCLAAIAVEVQPVAALVGGTASQD
jgi:hypothetical protein